LLFPSQKGLPDGRALLASHSLLYYGDEMLLVWPCLAHPECHSCFKALALTCWTLPIGGSKSAVSYVPTFQMALPWRRMWVTTLPSILVLLFWKPDRGEGYPPCLYCSSSRLIGTSLRHMYGMDVIYNDIIHSRRFERKADRSAETRGELASSAAAHMSSRFRLHFISLVVVGAYARFIRWDVMSAAIVSK